ncbi:glycosyltransferase [Thermaurantimonas aggregans]|uniref:glycosyltransferase n=1 Tax=Thermaurantimonas aggregans TaxID=2173829 RepID=UPI0023F50E58|nr:glycosyltransferase [Thermaurantimonas aggregans]MCX8148579.1 glycosyltransferase [Thermaurantimonas aggregans]
MIDVSICLITYNHERYLHDAFESIFKQKLNGLKIEIVVGEDCSTDSTRTIIIKYREKYGDIVKPIFREKNIGVVRNYVDTLSKCSGKYVAILSGDDYWIDENKLFYQFSFLENNPEYVMIGNNAFHHKYYKKGLINLGKTNQREIALDIHTKDLFLHNPFTASQIMFKNKIIKDFPEIYFSSTGEDRQFFMMLSQHGKCLLDPHVTGVYRSHPESITSKVKSNSQIIDRLYERINNAENWNKYFDNKYEDQVKIVKKQTYKKILHYSLKGFYFKKAVNCIDHLTISDFERKSVKLSFLMAKFIKKLFN